MEIHWAHVLEVNQSAYKSIGPGRFWLDAFKLSHSFTAARMFCAKILTGRQDMDLGKTIILQTLKKDYDFLTRTVK